MLVEGLLSLRRLASHARTQPVCTPIAEPAITLTRRHIFGAAVSGLLALAAPASPTAAQDLAAMPIQAMVDQAPDLPPAGLYMLAERLFSAGRRDEGVTWFYIAQIRSRVRLAAAPDLSPDGEPALYAALNDSLGRPINEWAFGDIDRVAAQMQEALDWDASHANAFTPKASNAAALEQVRSGLAALRTSVLARKDEIRRQRLANGLINR